MMGGQKMYLVLEYSEGHGFGTPEAVLGSLEEAESWINCNYPYDWEWMVFELSLGEIPKCVFRNNKRVS